MDVAQCLLDGNADAVEFCPHEPYHNILAASTYNLQEQPDHLPSRRGSISLFHVDPDSADDDKKLELTHRVETAGIFDIKWNSFSTTSGGGGVGPLLAQADADGCVRVHRLLTNDQVSSSMENTLKEVAGEQVSSSMCLCLDWNPSATSISVGLSNGSVSIVSFLDSELSIQQEWKGHQYEVWAASFDIHQPQLVYTGSDDCKFCCWDLRDCPSKLAFQNSKTHTMGVCCISKDPNDPHTLLTGSYDEYLRVWDMRYISKPVNETSICLGGGVWRIKHHPNVPGLVLAACMHNGFSVVKIKGKKVEIAENYNKHESLAYGADWQRGDSCREGKRKSGAVATCSFYDRLLRIWVPENDI